MPIGVSARLSVKTECIHEFETCFLEYQRKVRDSEPGNLFFHLHRNPHKPGDYLVMEQYQDSDALQAHKAADYYLAISATFGAFMSTPPVIEEFDTV